MKNCDHDPDKIMTKRKILPGAWEGSLQVFLLERSVNAR